MADESKPSDKPFKVYRAVLPIERRSFLPDWTDSGDEPVHPPPGGENYLSDLQEMAARVVARYGGPDAFDAFVKSHRHSLPTDAAVALILGSRLWHLVDAIATGDVYKVIAATVFIERGLAERWREFHKATGQKSAQARKEKTGETDRERADLYEQCIRKIARLQSDNPHLSKNAAVILATKEIGKSRAWFYRCEKLFATGR